MKITVRALTPVEADSLSVQVLSSQNTSGGGSDRGSASVDWPLLRYGLQGDPGFEIGDVQIEYRLIPEAELCRTPGHFGYRACRAHLAASGSAGIPDPRAPRRP